MYRGIACVAVLAALVLGPAACDDNGTEIENERFIAGLSGTEATASSATGVAEFEVLDNGSVRYSIDVQDLDGITMAHIHGPAPLGGNAGVIVWLYPAGATQPGTPTGTINGELVQGTFQATNNTAVSMDSLLVLMRNGRSYVNIHTTSFGGGEIRGHIVPR